MWKRQSLQCLPHSPRFATASPCATKSEAGLEILGAGCGTLLFGKEENLFVLCFTVWSCLSQWSIWTHPFIDLALWTVPGTTWHTCFLTILSKGRNCRKEGWAACPVCKFRARPQCHQGWGASPRSPSLHDSTGLDSRHWAFLFPHLPSKDSAKTMGNGDWMGAEWAKKRVASIPWPKSTSRQDGSHVESPKLGTECLHWTRWTNIQFGSYCVHSLSMSMSFSLPISFSFSGLTLCVCVEHLKRCKTSCGSNLVEFRIFAVTSYVQGGSESHSIHCPTKTVVWDCDIGTDHPDVPAIFQFANFHFVVNGNRPSQEPARR